MTTLTRYIGMRAIKSKAGAEVVKVLLRLGATGEYAPEEHS
jgi:hypothetical protein